MCNLATRLDVLGSELLKRGSLALVDGHVLAHHLRGRGALRQRTQRARALAAGSCGAGGGAAAGTRSRRGRASLRSMPSLRGKPPTMTARRERGTREAKRCYVRAARSRSRGGRGGAPATFTSLHATSTSVVATMPARRSVSGGAAAAHRATPQTRATCRAATQHDMRQRASSTCSDRLFAAAGERARAAAGRKPARRPRGIQCREQGWPRAAPPRTTHISPRNRPRPTHTPETRRITRHLV